MSISSTKDTVSRSMDHSKQFDVSDQPIMPRINQEQATSYQDPEDVMFKPTKFSDDLENLRRDRMTRQKMLDDLRHTHALKRASLNRRMGYVPPLSIDGGMTAPDYFDDGLLNGSAPRINSSYKQPWGRDYYHPSEQSVYIPAGKVVENL